MSEHTKEPWRLTSFEGRHSIGANLPCVNGLDARFELAVVYSPDDAEVGYTDGILNPDSALANARRIVECVNALAGMNPAALAGLIEAAEAVVNFETGALDDVRLALAKLRETPDA